jgi:predicted RNA-binding protein with PUA-like domain
VGRGQGQAGRKLKHPVTLKQIKATPELADMDLIRQSRLSVSAVKPDEWARIIAMSEAATA